MSQSNDPIAEPIAIVGMSGRFPGARSVEEFWKNLIEGVDTITRFTEAETEFSVATPDTIARGEKLVRARGVLDEPALFDAEFFGIYPREAEIMDPQHRVFLECAWEAIEQAGYDPAVYPGLIGVYAGLSLNTYLLHNLSATSRRLAGNYQVAEYQAMMGNDKDFMPTRVAYKMNLRGPTMAIQTACSTSLVAVSQACTALQTYQCDMALAGGVSISFPQRRDYLYQEDGMVSPDGTCRSFDAGAKGTVFGHGSAVVLLKRLSDALADSDTILAVIRGSAVNNDGSEKIGYAAPSVNAQADVIAMAQAAASVTPDSISYIEAHGTGTPLGDPIEVAALAKAFRDGGATGNGFCALGTGKTHIGHLDVAAGATGLIKTILQLQHETIPPLLHFHAPNPRIDFAGSPFYPVQKPIAWKRGDAPRRAGVSAFGVGGTNAHVVVEEAPEPATTSASRAAQVLVLSARTPAALEAMSANLADHLVEHPALDLADVAFTLAKGRRAFKHRRSLVVTDHESAIATLRQTSIAKATNDEATRVVFLFPGQGAQHVDMGRALYESEPVFRGEVDRCAQILKEHLGEDVREVLYPSDQNRAEAERRIHQTAITQPAIFVIEYALARQWMAWGIQPAALVGHSIGEYVAAVLAGTFTLEEALALLAERARLMQALPAGSMLVVRLSVEEITPLLPAGAEIAAINSPKLCTVSGPTDLLEAFRQDLETKAIITKPLSTSHAFHSAMMDSLTAPFAAIAARTPARAPQIPWVSTCTGTWMTEKDLSDPAYWSRQLRRPVRFSEAMATLASERYSLLLEAGPGQSLAQLSRQNIDHAIAISALSEDDPHATQAALGRLWSAGAIPDWNAYFSAETRRRVPLPTYPFERKRFWIEPATIEPEPVEEIVLTEAEPAPPSTPQDRRSELSSALTGLIEELSGKAITDEHAKFVELGFDSLFLTQVSQALLTRFGAKVTFRQLLGELSSVAALAQHLTAVLPETTAVTPIAKENKTVSRLPVIRWPQGARTTPAGTKRFGPFKPIERGRDGGLTAKQQKALDDLIARYTRRTAGSKSYTAEHRPHYADPRAVSGFQSLWKEMVYPIVSARSEGATIWDVDGNAYVDITMGFGTYFFGHSPSWLVSAVQDQLQHGIEIGPQSAAAGEIARGICEFSGMDRATFCNTGSEAVMAAIRLARTVTGRSRVAYFTGDYHGMFDEVLVRGSWVNGEYRAQPVAPGIPPSLIENMLVLDYAAPESLEILRTHAHELAAVLVEPVQSRQPDLQPRAFMHELRALTARSGAALIFDEIVTGFRCHPGGAQKYFGVEADMATYGKVIGGGIPIGVLAGKRQYMDALDGGAWNYGDDSFPEVGVTFFAGTFVRHPLAMAAARAVLDHLREKGPALQLRMNERTALLCRTLNALFEEAGVPIRLPHFSAFAVIEHAPDLPFASLLWYYLREKGIHVWEGRPIYLTLAHTDEDFDKVVRAFQESIAEMQEAGFLPGTSHSGLPAAFPRVDAAPATEAQREIWVSAQMGDDANRAYNESNTITFEGSLDLPALEKALLHVVQRHPSLRSTFSADGGQQLFHPAPEHLEIPFIEGDLTDLQSRCATHAFDLVNGPLLLLQLVNLAKDRHALLFTAHHMICDGWSFGMIVDELSQSYNAFRSARVPMLPPPMAFGDYARSLKGQSGNAPDRDYWIAQFKHGAPVLELPTDRPRPPLKSYPGAMATHVLDGGRFARLKKAAPQLGGTVFATLLGTFATLLHRLSGQDDLVIGVPSAGQTLAGCDELVGHCLNFLPLRLRCPDDPAFTTFAAHVQKAVLDAYEHQNYTFGSLVRELKLPRDASRLPLVSVMFNIDKSGFDHLQFDGLTFSVRTNAKQFVNFDLFFNLAQSEDRLEIECEYNTDLFDAATIRRWLVSFETLIEGILTKGETPLSALPILGGDEQHDLLTTWNATHREYPRTEGVQSLIAQTARAYPDKTAVRCGDETLTYAELEHRSNQLAAHLQSLGLKTGDLAGLFVERSPRMVVGLLGILKCGAAYVPMDPLFPAERLAFMVEDAHMPVLVTQSSLQETLPAHQAKIVLLDHLLPDLPQTFVPEHGGGENLAYVIFTSGSTGRPKGVRIPHRALTNFLTSMRREPGLRPDDILLSVTTLSFDISGLEIFLPLTTGATVVIAAGETLTDGNLLRQEMERNATTVLQATPATWRLLLAAGWLGSKNLKILIGGEAVSRELVNELAPRCAELWNVYGPTETTIWSTTTKLNAGQGPVAIGHPIDNTQVYIVSPTLQLQPTGVAGELLIGGDGLAEGYHDRPDLTADRFIPDPFRKSAGARLYRTGDLARWRNDASLECLGRLDHQVKIRGYRIELGEIETVLEKHAGVRQAVVLAREDNPGQKRLVAYVVAEAHDDLPQILRQHLRASLPEYMVPAIVVPLDRFPLTPNGKVDRRALPAPGAAFLPTPQEFTAPASPDEETLAAIWREVLQIENVGTTDDIFDLGGDSIFIFQITTRANQAGLKISPAVIFQHRTIAEILRHTAVSSSASPLSIKRINRDSYRARPDQAAGVGELVFPSALAQEAFCYLEKLQPGATPFNVAVRARLDGPLNVALVKQAFDIMVERHEILRTGFEDGSGELFQVVVPSVDLPFSVQDISSLPENAREAEVVRLGLIEARTPFDLDRAPLIRVLLVRLSDVAHVLHVSLHHAVSDGWSIGVVNDELAAIYDALARGQTSPLPPLAIQYADFAVWQRDFLAGPEMAGQMNYWKTRLHDLVEPELPTDFPRPPVKRWNGDIVSELLAVDLTDRLHDIARENGATLFHVFLTAFKILLHRYTDSTDIAIGSPIAGRNRPELEPLIGAFINTVILRTDLSGNPGFSTALQRVRDSMVEAVANQDIPFEALVRELKPERDSSRNPLFQINFTHQRAFIKPMAFGDSFGGVKLTGIPSLSPGAIFDLHFFTVERDGIWRVSCDFCTDLFERETALRMLGHYRMLLEGIAANPVRPVGELPLLTTAERVDLDKWSGETTAYPRDANIGSRFVEMANRHPQNIALVHGDRTFTYRQLHAYASRLALTLRDHGVGPGSMVAVATSRSPELIAGLVAITLAGGAYVPIDPTHPAERIRFLMDDAGASIMLADPDAVPDCADGSHRVITFDPLDPAAKSAPVEVEVPGLTALHPAYVLYTSGSTGLPKGAVIPHRGVVRLVCGTNYMNFGPDEVFLQAAPLSFDASTLEIWGPLLNGGKLVLIDSESSGLIHIAQAVRTHRVTTLWLTAGLFQIMVDEHLDDLKSLRNLLAGGDVLPIAHVRRAFEALPGTRLINGYGPTENTTFTTCHTITAADLQKASIPIGRPIANTTVFILDQYGQQTPAGIPGELFTGGDGLAIGYLGNPELTAAKFVPNSLPGHEGEILYRTGDRACWRHDGTIEFLGRRDRQVKIRGVRIEPGEVESVLSAHPAVGRCRVGIRGRTAGNKTLVAWVSPAPGAFMDQSALAEYLSDRLPPFLCPDAIVVLDSLPLTPNGKIDLAALPDPDHEDRTRSAPPVTDTEKQLAAIWAELLGVTQVGRDDNFFHRGGHSLLGLKLFSRILHSFNIALPLATLLKAPTVRSLASILDVEIEAQQEKETGHHGAVLATIQRDGNLPPLFCVHGGDGGIIFFQNLAARLPHDRPFVAIEAPALRATDEIRVGRVEDTAREYLTLIRKRQSQGPYHLGGYSFGGAVAYEMARLLRAEGEEVSLLALFDTFNPAVPTEEFTFAERVSRFWSRRAGVSLPRRLQAVAAHGLGRIRHRLFGSGSVVEEESDSRSQQLNEAHFQSLSAYRPQPYPGKLTLFKAAIDDEIYKIPDDYGWSSLVTELEIIVVPGRHLTIFDPAHVGRFAAELRKRLSSGPA
ncbi:MAG: amino acid adenylation domain-containing protein [Terrimicrobiaceae bacterium]